VIVSLSLPTSWRQQAFELRGYENSTGREVMSRTVAIIVPVYNGGSLFRELLSALANQVDAPAFEVVLADNGSTDESQSIASGFQDRLNIRWVHASDGKGPAYARHVGVLNTSADRLLFLDQDDVPNVSYVYAMSRALEHSVYVYAQVDVERLNPEWQWRRQKRYNPIFVGGWPLLLGGTIGIRRDAYENSGGWGTNPWLDDADFCYRVFLTLGSAPSLAAGALLHYRYRPDGKSVFRQMRRWGRMAARTNRKFRPRGYAVESEWTLAGRMWCLARSVRSICYRTDRYFWLAEAGYVLGRVEMNVHDLIRRPTL
jgi:glycosyltransferase involved in cell wall biosynthesis